MKQVLYFSSSQPAMWVVNKSVFKKRAQCITALALEYFSSQQGTMVYDRIRPNLNMVTYVQCKQMILGSKKPNNHV